MSRERVIKVKDTHIAAEHHNRLHMHRSKMVHATMVFDSAVSVSRLGAVDVLAIPPTTCQSLSEVCYFCQSTVFKGSWMQTRGIKSLRP